MLKNLSARTGRAPEQLLEEALAEYESSNVAALDWSQCPVVERVPGKVSGAWVLRGTRMPAATIFENLESGDFWTEHGIGPRVCALIDAARQAEPTLLASGESLRDQVDRLLPGLVRVGVADAARLKRALQTDARRTS